MLDTVQSPLSRRTFARVDRLFDLLVLVVNANVQRGVEILDGIEIPARRHHRVGPFPHGRL